MSNLIIGVIGVILFIGMALAGASFLGPNSMNSAIKIAEAAVLEANGSVANAVQVRERELEVLTLANSVPAEILHPRFINEMPQNPTGGPSHIFINQSGTLTGTASYVAMKLAGPNARSICLALNKRGLGPANLATRAGPPSNKVQGCFIASRNIAAGILLGDYISYTSLGT